MKKVIKIICAILLSIGVIALIVCMIAIPNETKEFLNIVFDLLDKPIVLCGVSITLGGALTFFLTRYIMSNTSIGKKNLIDLNNKIIANGKVSKEKYDELKNKISDNEKLEKRRFDNINNSLKTLNNALLQVPNKKVQEVLNNGTEND